MNDLTLMDCIAIIPARGGSKRLPKKNLLPLIDKPLIRWAIDEAKESGIFERIIVTSDDEEILEISKQSEVDFVKRPTEISTDISTTYEAILHLLECQKKNNLFPSHFVVLQPTSPLRTAEDIKNAYKEFINSKADSLISVCITEHSPLWSNTLNETLSMDRFLDKNILNVRSQDLPTYYRINGAIYMAKTQSYVNHKGFFMPNSRAFIMPQERSIDIDSLLDFQIVETILRQ
ncbi:cytidylyltransferase domain-containing protein [Leptospira santarosai]|uniref:acylneuraminate cytidylyltransferase family protein n=1 Tax=Leptospira santarosai TaxID=28183 RepID=UPI001E4628E1|nr:acylneuraminate cytidylyltransferase family protein [Leptospira santarosai]